MLQTWNSQSIREPNLSQSHFLILLFFIFHFSMFIFIKSAICSSLFYLLTQTSMLLVEMHLQLKVKGYLRLFIFF